MIEIIIIIIVMVIIIIISILRKFIVTITIGKVSNKLMVWYNVG